MIEAQQLTKLYGKEKALDALNTHFPAGQITGLLGPNGAGKTTLLSILTGIIPKSAGFVRVAGLDLDKELKAIRRLSALVPQRLAFYPALSAYENLEFFAALSSVTGQAFKTRLDYCLSVTGLEGVLKKKAQNLSGGFKRRLNLALGLLASPKILYLDEPTVGVDAQSRIRLLEMVRKLKSQDVTIVYTSHYLEEIEKISDHIVVLGHGRQMLSEKKSRLLRQSSALSFLVDSLPQPLLEQLKSLGFDFFDGRLTLPFGDDLARRLSQGAALLAEKKVDLKKVEGQHSRLQELYFSLVEKASKERNR